MSLSREIKVLQKAKSRAQNSHSLKEEASLCNQLGEALAKSGNFRAAIEEHRQELALSEVLHDVIGCAVANRKIGECFAELGDFEVALKHQNQHLDLARSVGDAAEEQRALATIGRTFLFRYESDQSRDSLLQAKEAFRNSLAIVDDRLEGAVAPREVSEMRARLYLNLGFVCDGLKDPQRCSDFIRRSVFIAEKNQLMEDLYRANFNLGNIHFRNGQPSKAVRCLEQAKECARKLKDKFGESECFCSIGQVLLTLGDFVAARRSLKKAFRLGSQQAVDRETVKRVLKRAIQGCRLEEAASELGEGRDQEAMGLAEQQGDLFCKVGCYTKALDAYRSQLSCALRLGKPARELAVIHVSLAATYTDLRLHLKAVEHYREELALRQGNPKEECESWLNIASSLEEGGAALEELDTCYQSALGCAKTAGRPALQRQALQAWLSARQRGGSPHCADTEAQLQQLPVDEEVEVEEEEEEEEEVENSEPLEESDIELSDSDEDLEEYDKAVPGRRKTSRWNRRNEKGETSLHRACIDGNLGQVQYLVEQGHPINPRDYCGWTPLHEASNHGHLEIVALLLERGANVNDPGGNLCEGVTPLHDSLSCGHFQVAQLLVEKGASVNLRNSKGETPLDCLRKWRKMYSQDLDRQTRQECGDTEAKLRRAASRSACTAPTATHPFSGLKDSQLFDAENSEPLVSSWGRRSPDLGLQQSQRAEVERQASSPRRRSSTGRNRRPRGTEAAVLYGQESSSSEQSDSDDSISPLRPVRPRLRFPDPPSPQTVPPSLDIPTAIRREASPPPVCISEEYQRTIRNLGSAKTRLLTRDLSDPELSSTPLPPTNSLSALVPEEEYVVDDWLEDDVSAAQPRKRRRVGSEQDWRRETSSATAESPPSWRIQSLRTASWEPPARVATTSNRSHKGAQKARQVKMTQLSGMVMLGRREVIRPQSPSLEEEPVGMTANHTRIMQSQAQAPPQSMAAPMPTPIRMRVRVQDNVFLIPVPHSIADSCTVSWLCDQASQRYYQACGLLPRLTLQKEGALLSPLDLLLAVLQTNEEVLAEVSSWDLPPLPERYKKACQSLAVDENRLVFRLCEAQDCSSSVSVCGLGLTPATLAPLLRALKLQAGLTQLRLSGNRLTDDLMPEVISAATTMPRLRLLDLSSNCITGEGLKKAAEVLTGQSQPAFPCLEELCLSMNLLGDGMSQDLSCLLSACPLLANLALQSCGLTARFLQQNRLLLAEALSGSGHLRSLCLSHNSLGSTGLELVLKTLPLCLTHLYLSAVRSGPVDPPVMDRLTGHLSQEGCSLTHLSLAGNGLTDGDIASLARCLPVCPSLVSLDLSGNPDVTAAGLENLLAALRDAQRSLTYLNLQGCQVSGPWEDVTLHSLASCVQDLRLCSQRLNKLDQRALLQSWEDRDAVILLRGSKCLMRATQVL